MNKMKENESKNLACIGAKISELAEQLQVVMDMAIHLDEDYHSEAKHLLAAAVTARETFEKIERLADSIG